jgi:phosphoribosylformylglycinamidine cyclo-ligase
MSDPLTYRDAGVDIDAGNEAVKRIKRILGRSPRSVTGGAELGGVGGFSALFRPSLDGYTDPLLVSSTDGVGTKLLLALEHNRLDTIGQDLVAMCVNDLVVCGARPLFFLDYIATAKLDPEQIETIVGSIQSACEESDCLLVGGECAEMPGMYAPGHTDLAGFSVGIVDRPKVIDGTAVEPGDVVLGLASSGFHSNGFSLVRKVIERGGWKPDDCVPGSGENLIKTILKPTRLYVRSIISVCTALGIGKSGAIHACAHITGGGLTENLNRVIPESVSAEICRGSWPEPVVFQWVQSEANLPDVEMDRTFNRGIGMMLVVDKNKVEAVKSHLEGVGEQVYNIGVITKRVAGSPSIKVI